MATQHYSAGFEIKFSGDHYEVKQWLQKNVKYDRLSNSGWSGFDRYNRVVFGLCRGNYSVAPYVYLKEEKDALLFSLRWR